MNYKIKLIIGLLFVSVISMNAQQNEKSSKESSQKDYLPQKGNIGVGALATPLFNFVGNMLSSGGTNKLDMKMPGIIVKYYLTDMSAVRAAILIGSGTTKNAYYSQDDALFLTNPLSTTEVVDNKVTQTSDYEISLGLQKFVGKNRLRGFYGAQVLCGYNSDKVVYSYGNPMTLLNPTPTVNLSITGAYSGAERILENKTSSKLSTGLGGIAGFEYYVMPKLCVGGEVSLNLIYNMYGQTYKKSEKIEKGQYITIDKALSPAYSDFSVETLSFSPTGGYQVGFYVMLHF